MILTLDTETTTFAKGNPFSRRNKLCYVGIDLDGVYSDYDIEYSADPYGESLEAIRESFSKASLIVGFNLKFDLHWMDRYDVNLGIGSNIWDCQLAEFILSHQKWAYPDLDEACFRRGLGRKLDVVDAEYWSLGIDTPEVPRDTLRSYLQRDVELTKALYEAQCAEFERADPRLYTLFRLQCADLLVLMGMEWNGLLYDVQRSSELAAKAVSRLNDIDAQLSKLVGVHGINWNSDDHLSAVLYGGDISLRERVPTSRVLKDGSTKLGEKWGWRTVTLPRLVAPLPNTETLPTRKWSDEELQRENIGREKPFVRVYSVGEPVIKSLRCTGGAKQIIKALLERADIAKRESTYYRGIPQVIEEMDWEPGIIHGQLNQCVARTGRLSASKPNQQNFDHEIKPLFGSRYAD